MRKKIFTLFLFSILAFDIGAQIDKVEYPKGESKTRNIDSSEKNFSKQTKDIIPFENGDKWQILPWEQNGTEASPGKSMITPNERSVTTSSRSSDKQSANLRRISPESSVIDDGTRVQGVGLVIEVGDLSFRPTQDFVISKTPITNSQLLSCTNTVYANGKYYGSYGTIGGGVMWYPSFYVFNAETGETEQKIALPSGYQNYAPQMAYNPVDGKVYAISYDAVRNTYFSILDAELDPIDGLYTVICPFYESLAAMAFSPEGVLYAVTSSGDLKTINLQTGELTLIGHTGIDKVVYAQSIAFDYRTGKLYWAAIMDEETKISSVFYEINTETAGLTKLRQLEDYCQIVGLHILSPQAEAKAPYVVDALTVTFAAPGTLDGTITLTAPTKAYDKSDLSGTLDIKVYVNDLLIKEIQLQAGADTEIQHSFAGNGEYKISVIASNSAGEGVKGSISIYAGMDAPKVVNDLKLEVTESGLATLTWNTPDEGINDGYVDPEQITYKIVRMPGNVDRSTTGETSFSENLPDDLARYYYIVTPSIGEMKGEALNSNSVVSGDGIIPPLVTQMGSITPGTIAGNFFNFCNIFDNDNNGYTFYESWNSAAVNTGYNEGTSDDWIITPPFQLEKGVYKVKFRYFPVQGTSSLKFTMGRAQTPDAQNIVLLDDVDYTEPALGSANKYVDEYIVIKESGKYYFGINFYTYNDGSDQGFSTYASTAINDFSIETGSDLSTPEQVSALEAVAHSEGQLKADISFTTPSKDFEGMDLTTLEKVEVYNGEKLIETLDAPEIGKSYTVTDEEASQGFNEYIVMVYNEHGVGGVSSVKVYVGQDAPQVVSWVKTEYESNYKINLTWGEPSTTGLNGGYADPVSIRYKLARAEDIYGIADVSEAQNLKEKSYSFDETATVSTGQNIISYGVTPFNGLGEGQMGVANVVLGKPYEIFFNESFAGARRNTSYWSSVTLSGNQSWYVANGTDAGVAPQDNDGGLAVFYHIGNNETAGAIISPIISLIGTKNPALSFWMHHDSGVTDGSLLSIQVAGEDGKYTVLKSINLKDGNGWQEYTIPLTQFADQERVFIAFVGLIYNESSVIGIDNFAVYDNLKFDIEAISFNAPSGLTIGEKAKFIGTIRNKGTDTASDYKVELYANDELIGTQTGRALVQKETAEIEFEVAPSPIYSDKEVTFRMISVLTGDEYTDNDTLMAKVQVSGNTLPVPANLTGSHNGEQALLSWNEPSDPILTQVTDDFESYEAFAINSINPWKLVDKDNQMVTYIQNRDIPNAGVPQAYQIWSPSTLQGSLEDSWNSNSGQQCLISWAASGLYSDWTYASEAKNDDWLISPRIAGRTKLEFYASEGSNTYGNEEFEVLVSYSTPDPEMFDLLEKVTVPGIGWKKYEYDLPEDACYFAIRCVSSDKFAFLIDDISYTAGYKGVELLGYNIYRNGQKLNEEPIEETHFADSYINEEGETSVYVVSAVYDEGESGLSNEVSIEGSGIYEGALDNISVIGGEAFIRIYEAANKEIVVYNVFGIIVNKLNATSNIETIPMDIKGVYIVQIGDTVRKVQVK